MRTPRAFLLVALTMACGTAPHPAPSPASMAAPSNPALADSVVALDASRTDSAARLGVVNAMSAMLTPDAVYLRAGQPMVFGADRVRRMLADAAPAAGSAMRWQPVRVGVSRDGLAAYTVGIAAAATSGSGAPVLRVDRYIAYWKRAPKGAWRMAAYVEVGPGTPGATPMDDPGKAPALSGVRDSMFRVLAGADSAFSALAGRSGLAAAFGDYAAPDAMVFGGSRLVVGPAAIRALYAGPDGGVLSWHAVAGEASGSADLGFTVGEYAFASDANHSVSHGKYLTIWTVLPSGAWCYVADGGNPNPPR